MAEKKKTKDTAYTVMVPNIYLRGRKWLRGDTLTLSDAEAKAILDGDKAAGRKPRIKK